MNPPMLAKDYDGRNPAGMWMSEKFDGVRAVWTGKELLTRAGNVIDCPAWFTKGLPSVALDGELWAGRGNFQLTKGMAQSKWREAGWNKLTLAVFDTPCALPLEDRVEWIHRMKFPENVFAVAQTCCNGPEHLAAEFVAVKRDDGEGLMLRIPGSPYLFGERSAYWQKVKRHPSLYKVTA